MQGEFSSPPSRFRARHFAAFLLAGTLLGLMGLVWLQNSREPRYRGKTSTQWFPYLWDFSKGPIPGAVLTNGAPESFPMLWSGLRKETPNWIGRCAALVNAFRANRKTLPGTTFFDVQTELERALLRSAQSRSFADLVASHWMELREVTRRELLQALAGDLRLGSIAPRVAENLEPILYPLLSSQDLESQQLAARLLLQLPNLQIEQLRRIARVGLSFPSGAWPYSQFWPSLYSFGGAGMAGRRAVAEVLAEQPEMHGDRFRLPLCLLDPERYPASGYWEPSGDLQRDLTRRVAVGEGIHLLAGGRLEEFAPWLEGYLLRDIESRDHPEEASVLNRKLDEDRFRFLSNQSVGLNDNSRWLDAVSKGLAATSARVRLAAAMAIVRGRGKSPAVTQSATAALLRRQDPEVMLRILTLAKVVPPEVAPLIQKLATGETPVGWPSVSSDVTDEARALLGAVGAGK